MLPTGEYLFKHKAIQVIPKCPACKIFDYTSRHIFGKCSKFKNLRIQLKKDLKEIKLDINFNFLLFRFGNNNKDIDTIDKKILKKIQNYTLDVWKFFKKRNILHI